MPCFRFRALFPERRRDAGAGGRARQRPCSWQSRRAPGLQGPEEPWGGVPPSCAPPPRSVAGWGRGCGPQLPLPVGVLRGGGCDLVGWRRARRGAPCWCRVGALRRAPPGSVPPTPPAAPTVLLPELLSLLPPAGRARLVDVRSREEAAAGTIPGAPSIPGKTSEPETAELRLTVLSSELESALQMEPAAWQALSSAEKPKLEDDNLIFFCQTGKRGLQATQLAQRRGYRGARSYAGAYREGFQKGG